MTSPTHFFAGAAPFTRKPIIDTELDTALSLLNAADTSLAADEARFALYVEATARATQQRGLMPDLPEAIAAAYERCVLRGYGDRIPSQVTAAHGRLLIVGMAARGQPLVAIQAATDTYKFLIHR